MNETQMALFRQIRLLMDRLAADLYATGPTSVNNGLLTPPRFDTSGAARLHLESLPPPPPGREYRLEATADGRWSVLCCEREQR